MKKILKEAGKASGALAIVAGLVALIAVLNVDKGSLAIVVGGFLGYTWIVKK
jgi:hypothetical protein